MKIVIAILLLLAATADKNYYAILGVPRNANDKQIKQAYRKLTLELHPDKNKGDPKAAEKFKEVNTGIPSHTAHEVLSDPEKRRIYDVQGEQGLKDLAQRQSVTTLQDWHPGKCRAGFGLLRIHLPRRRIQRKRTQSIAIYKATFERQILCPHCRGNGAESPEDVEVCPVCGGRGSTFRREVIGNGYFRQYQEE